MLYSLLVLVALLNKQSYIYNTKSVVFITVVHSDTTTTAMDLLDSPPQGFQPATHNDTGGLDALVAVFNADKREHKAEKK